MSPFGRNTSTIGEGDTFYLHDETTTGRQDGVYSATSRMKTLATQLGECCMAADLAALMSQKRRLELLALGKSEEGEEPKRSVREECEMVKAKKTLGSCNEETRMRALVFNIYTLITRDRKPEDLARARSPVNALYLYRSSAACQEMLKLNFYKVSAM